MKGALFFVILDGRGGEGALIFLILVCWQGSFIKSKKRSSIAKLCMALYAKMKETR